MGAYSALAGFKGAKKREGRKDGRKGQGRVEGEVRKGRGGQPPNLKTKLRLCPSLSNIVQLQVIAKHVR